MIGKDYEIILTDYNAYIGKKSKRNPGVMVGDRRLIEESEILMLIDWYLNKEAGEEGKGISFQSQVRRGQRIEMRFVDEKGGERA